jgi:hypothetical protein
MIPHKHILQSMLTCLQVMQAKVRLLQAQARLLNNELIDLKNQKLVNCFELVFVQNNPLCNDEDDDDDDYDDEQSVKGQLSKTAPNEKKI